MRSLGDPLSPRHEGPRVFDPRFETGGQLGSAQSTAGSGSTRGKVKGSSRTCGNFMGPASKSGLQTTPQYQQITATGAAQIWVQSGKFMGSVAAIVTGPITLPLWQHYASQVRLLYTCYACSLEWRSCWKPGLGPQAQRASTLLSGPSTRRNLEPQTEVASRRFGTRQRRSKPRNRCALFTAA